MLVFVRGLEVYAFHGFTDDERTVGHRFRVDIEVEVADESGAGDDVESIVDYTALATIAREVLEGGESRLIEPLAIRICDEVLAQHPRADSVEVSIEKIAPPMPMIAESVGVALRKARR